MPNRFDFDKKKEARFKTKDGYYVKLYKQTWCEHIINERGRAHLDFNRDAIIQTLLNYDKKTQSRTNKNVKIFQKKFNMFYINDHIRAPRVIIIAVHIKKKIILSIYEDEIFKK